MTAAFVRRWAPAALLAAVAVAAGFLWAGPELAQAWHLALTILTGLGLGALGLLMLGHLLGGYWLDPVRSELEAAVLTLPLTVLLALPLTAVLPDLFPWAAPGFDGGSLPAPRRAWFDETFFVLRSVAAWAVWLVLAALMVRPGPHNLLGGFGLVLLTPTASLAATDWIMSRDPDFWSGLFGFAFAVTGLLPALGLAILVAKVRSRGRPDTESLRSLERLLVSLALITLWIWFSHFLVIWMADLPAEARWYRLRWEALGWLKLGIVVPALATSVILLMLPHLGGPLLVTACALILVQHVAHMVWLAQPAGPAAGLTLLDAGVLGAFGLIWTVWFRAGLATRPPHDPS